MQKTLQDNNWVSLVIACYKNFYKPEGTFKTFFLLFIFVYAGFLMQHMGSLLLFLGFL